MDKHILTDEERKSHQDAISSFCKIDSYTESQVRALVLAARKNLNFVKELCEDIRISKHYPSIENLESSLEPFKDLK